MAKYGQKSKDKVGKALHEEKHGQLKSGRSGKTVKSRKQAIAIGLSEARKSGGKVPKKKSASKKSAAKKKAAPKEKSAAKKKTAPRKKSASPRKRSSTSRKKSAPKKKSASKKKSARKR